MDVRAQRELGRGRNRQKIAPATAGPALGALSAVVLLGCAVSAAAVSLTGQLSPPLTVDVANVLPRERTDLNARDMARVAAITAPTSDFSKPERFEMMAGGATTSRAAQNDRAFSHYSANMAFEARENFYLGSALFDKLWVSSPSSTLASDGLGPLFNARGCVRCHVNNGRGHAPSGVDDTAVSMLMRLSVPPATRADEATLASLDQLTIAEPNYGIQLQDFAVPGLRAEGRLRIAWEEHTVALAGGETVRLRRPVSQLTDLSRGAFASGTMTSLRVANPMIGLGLLEAIHPADIAALADPDDADGDGISGKASIVRDRESGALALGRFGWKATAPSLRVQTGEAFAGDIGISNPVIADAFGDCAVSHAECRALPTGVQAHLGGTEAPDPVLELVTYFSQHLAVPARRDVDHPEVLAGKALFYQAGCASCHTPKFVTSREAINPEHRFQLIWPYTDMLLHDMGEGLADHRPVGVASGREWRTPPLWGIGLTPVVNGHMELLHDGRARGVLEAILWHGGEAEAARQEVVEMNPEERAQLIRFVESL